MLQYEQESLWDEETAKALPTSINIVTTKLVRERSALKGVNKISCPSDVYDLLSQYFNELDREHFLVVCLNRKSEVTCINTVSIGGLYSTTVHPREIFKVAILSCADTVILAHNHPSGDPNPSREDIEITRRIADAGQLMGINVHDHIIFGDGRYFSLKEKAVI